jgi:hypothetical protein
LVQHEINKKGGSVAFVDDYTAWVIGHTSEANHEGIQTIIERALEWERRSGATFEADKTAIIDFSRKASRVDNSIPFRIKGETVQPTDQVKILGVAMDSELRFRQHIARAASKALEAVIALKQLNQTTQRSTYSGRTAAFYSDGSPRHGLRIERVEICVWDPTNKGG